MTATTTHEPATAEFAYLDANDVILADNVRVDQQLDDDFVTSISTHGVLQAVTCQRTVTGQIEVIYGQRRTLAARQAGVRLPAIVYSEHLDRAALIASQVTENEHRAALTTGELMGAAEQLALEGLDDQAIAGMLVRPTDTITRLRRAAASKAATAAAKTHPLTLDEADALAEFDDDPDATAALTRELGTGRFTHELQRRRIDRKEARQIADATAKLQAEGVTVIDEPAWDAKARPSRLDHLKNDKGKALTGANHRKCPGHVAWVRAFAYQDKAEVTYACTNPAKYGHQAAHGRLAEKPRAEDMDPTEREKAAAERRHVIQSNKDWAACTEVRRAWIRDHLTALTTPPEGAEQFIAQTMLQPNSWWNLHANGLTNTHKLVDLLGWADLDRDDLIERTSDLTPGRATVRTLAILIALWETALPTDAWRSKAGDIPVVLQHLADWGYPLSDIEHRILEGTDQA